MIAAIVPVVILAVIAFLCAATFSRLSMRSRLGVDFTCFALLSGYFFWRDEFPIFPVANDPWSVGAVAIRVAGGAWWIFGARVIAMTISVAMHRDRKSHETRLVSDLVAGGIYLAATLIILNAVFALPVTGVLATSGVVAIVLGLALQNTLADVFAGIAVGIEHPFGVGDRIQLNDKLEGLVVEVNWRSVRIQTDGDDIAIVPHSVVAKAEILNHSIPSQRRATSVELSCPESALPERVIATLLEATLLCPDILRTPRPVVLVTKLGPKRNRYKVNVYAEAVKGLAETKSMLLLLARRQLHYAGLLDFEGSAATFGPLSDAAAPIRLLRDVTLFESLTGEQIDVLARKLTAHQLEPGEHLFKQGDAGRALYLIGGGVLEVTQGTEGRGAETIGCLGAGEYVGEIGLLSGAAHIATAAARTHCMVYELRRESLAPLLDQNNDLAAAFDKSARKGLEMLHRRVAVRASPEIGPSGQFLARIRQLLKVS